MTRSARPARIALSLTADPLGRIRVPFTCRPLEHAQRCLYVVPTALVFKSSTDHLRDKRAPPAGPDATIEFRHQVLLQRYCTRMCLR